MNTVIKQLQNRRSVRDFTGEGVSEEHLQIILETAQRAPTSINGQQTSLIYTRDKKIIAQIAELAGGQSQVATAEVFITIVADFNRTNYAVMEGGKEQIIQTAMEGVLVGAVDAGIMLEALQTAAESFGYGTTAIGAVRRDTAAMIDLLGLPPKTFPIVGTTIGVPSQKAKEAPLKPRMPMKSFAFEDRYDDAAVKEGVSAYEAELKDFRESHGMNYKVSYMETTGDFYSKIYFREVSENLKKQGFDFK